MTTAGPNGSRVRRARRTQVQLVELYTRLTLHVFLWTFQLALLLGLAPQAAEQRDAMVLVALVALLLAGLAVPVLRTAIRLYPARGPVPWRHVAPLLVASTLALAALPLLSGDLRDGAALLVWLPLLWSLSGLRAPVWTAVTLACAVAIPAVASGPSVVGTVVGLLGGLFVLFTVRVSLWLEDVVRQLDRARGTRAELAVAEERLRFSRDVHDVLGRRLATIAVQSELAATLAGRGDERAQAQMLEVRAAAHDALREARALARGYRDIDLATELDGATSLLRSAGIDFRADLDGLPPERREAAAWVVRETVTNVLRHSAATAVDVRWDGTALVVRNDGVSLGPEGSTPDGGLDLDVPGNGAGLVGLRERLRPRGGDVTAHRDGDGFVLRAELGRSAPAPTGAPS